MEQVICRYGCPIAILTDKGKEVDGQLMAEVCRCLDIDKLHTTSYKQAVNHRKNACAWMFKWVPYSQRYLVLGLVGLVELVGLVGLGLPTVTVRVSRVSVMVSVRDSVKCA